MLKKVVELLKSFRTHISIVSFGGIFVKRFSMSKDAIIRFSEFSTLIISSQNEYEFLSVYSLMVRLFKWETKNLEILYEGVL